jgi:hypothetical protein
MFDNFYVRFLLGGDAFVWPAGAVTETHLIEAKRILGGFALVAPTSQLKASLLPVLQTQLG